MPEIAPYGSWPSSITPELLVEQVVGLSDVTVDGDRVLWSELRPQEGGRVVLVADGADLIDAPLSARTLVHEYGGRCTATRAGTVIFSNQSDQRLWKLGPDGATTAVTPEPDAPASVRFADPVMTPDGAWVVAVRERHGTTVDNDVVAVRVDGSSAPEVLVSGHDFFSAPRLSPDGTRLAWVCWDHPNMPWDSSELWVGDFDGALTGAVRVAGGSGESVGQPRWSPDGRLHFVSDRTGWWNIYDEDGTALAPMEAEFSAPDWVFGQSTYAFLADGRLVATWQDGAGERIGLVSGGTVQPLEFDRSFFESVTAAGGTIVAIAASPSIPPAVVRIDVDAGSLVEIRSSRTVPVPAAELSEPEHVEFPTEGGLRSHALFYPPVNSGFAAPADERPPLVVMSHGGPTSQASPALNLRIQYWTNRGFAVVDVDYGGSSGYGRAYRDRLEGAWGIVDLDDCVNAARWLASEGRVDGDRMVIRGGSAGGYTTLCALTFRDVFAAGASLYGVADAELLAKDTHKFESRYLDGLIGPYPEAADEYRRRSPIHYADQITCPVIVFQGLEDKVVPPEQSEVIVSALRRSGVPVAYLTFEGEQHGFRRAETIMAVARAELAFYGRVLGFRPAGDPVDLTIDNEAALRR
ncbi:MAG: S9 family peptidase [Acidimicrobiales bacterium]